MNIKKTAESKTSRNAGNIKKDKIQNLITKGDYQQAEELLQVYRRESIEYDDVIAILDAGIGEYYGDRKRVWEAIRKGLMFNIRNYELYVMLGNYYLPENQYQSYLCYENAMFYCDDPKDKIAIEQLLCQLVDHYDIKVNKVSLVILSDNSLEKTKLCISSIRMTTAENIRDMIVVDNGSADGSVEWLREQKDIILIENNERKGFSEAFNQGVSASEEENDIFLLSNNTVLLLNSLFWLRMGLYDGNENGMAGSISNIEMDREAFGPAGPKTDLFAFGEKTNIPMKYFYIDKLCLNQSALLIKRSVLNKIGVFDEKFLLGDSGIKDYGLRVLEAGNRNILCKNSFVICLEELDQRESLDYHDNFRNDHRRFGDKWGFDLNYYFGINQAIIELVKEPMEKELHFLEIGCGCGALMERLKSMYPNAKMYGMELVPEVAKIASYTGEVLCGNVEDEDFPWEKEYFDYIIMGDVLEHLMTPGNVLKKVRDYLKASGHIIISMPNVKHYSVLLPLLRYDTFSYTDSGILDRTHVKMYTKTEILKLITGSGYEAEEIYCTKVGIPNEDELSMIKVLMSFMENPSDETFLAYQYILKAGKR